MCAVSLFLCILPAPSTILAASKRAASPRDHWTGNTQSIFTLTLVLGFPVFDLGVLLFCMNIGRSICGLARYFAVLFGVE